MYPQNGLGQQQHTDDRQSVRLVSIPRGVCMLRICKQDRAQKKRTLEDSRDAINFDCLSISTPTTRRSQVRSCSSLSNVFLSMRLPDGCSTDSYTMSTRRDLYGTLWVASSTVCLHSVQKLALCRQPRRTACVIWTFSSTAISRRGHMNRGWFRGASLLCVSCAIFDAPFQPALFSGRSSVSVLS